MRSNVGAKLNGMPQAHVGGIAIDASRTDTDSGTSTNVNPNQRATPFKSTTEATDHIIMQGYKRIATDHRALDDLKNTNPNWQEDSPWDVNCQRCVSAYEARRRGYDVTAAPLLDNQDTLLPPYSF